MRAIGAVLIVLGVIGLLYGGFSYVKRDKILDVGPIQATRTETRTIPVPPIAGAVALIAGIFPVVAPQRT